MDKLINETYYTIYWKFDDYVPPPLGTRERSKEGLAIEQHLLNLQKHCKQCLKRDILPDIFIDLKFFREIRDGKPIVYPHKQRKYMSARPTHNRTKPFMIVTNIMYLLTEPRTPEYYRDLRVFVACMFIAMKKSRLFDWD